MSAIEHAHERSYRPHIRNLGDLSLVLLLVIMFRMLTSFKAPGSRVSPLEGVVPNRSTCDSKI